MEGKLEYNFTIPNRDVDLNKQLRLSSLFAYFQDIACEHAGIIGPDVNALANEYGVAWILMRMRVEIDRLPSIYEEITLTTWPCDNKILFDRDYTLADANGNIIISCASTWILMNLEKRELVKKRPFEFYEVDYLDKRALETKPSKIKLPGTPAFKFEKVVSFSDLDYNMHLNNAKYLDYISDCIDLNMHKNFNVKVIEVNYSNEARFGDNLTLYEDKSMIDDNIIFIEGKSNDVVLFTSKLELEKK